MYDQVYFEANPVQGAAAVSAHAYGCAMVALLDGAFYTTDGLIQLFRAQAQTTASAARAGGRP